MKSMKEWCRLKMMSFDELQPLGDLNFRKVRELLNLNFGGRGKPAHVAADVEVDVVVGVLEEAVVERVGGAGLGERIHP